MNLPENLQTNVASEHIIPERIADFCPFPADMHTDVVNALKQQGINALYLHQLAAWEAIRSRQNCMITSGTSSGKTLSYLLPILQDLIETPYASYLFLYPTRALANDQLEKINTILAPNAKTSAFNSMAGKVGIFDGDTKPSLRKSVRENAKLILSNPDMLHIGVLPHHTRWVHFFQNLKYVIFDEVHAYKGVFGSHVANIIRRLKRIANFYGSRPIFILSSATIGNPKEFAYALLEDEVKLISDDGSFRAEQKILFYNPPIIEEKLGIRSGTHSEAWKWIQYLDNFDTQTIIFTRSRRSVELLVKNVEDAAQIQSGEFSGYRSGYLFKFRRQIEKGIRDGIIRFVISTNALELGIDIGNVENVIILGYPGSSTSFRQQAGRAGRKHKQGLCVFIASSNPLDQFLIRHPTFLLNMPVERIFLDANNPFILIDHLRCAAFELPIKKGENFGNIPWDVLKVYLEVLESQDGIIFRNSSTFWISDSYPASKFSIRSINNDQILLIDEEKPIGTIDYASSLWMTHPGALYLHQGNTYLVKDLDLVRKQATMEKTDSIYFTEAQIKRQIFEISLKDYIEERNYQIGYGDISISTQVIGYKKILWDTSEVIGIVALDSPEMTLNTKCSCLKINPALVKNLQSQQEWKSTPNDYGKQWKELVKQIKDRDEYTCQFCRKRENQLESVFHVHHVIPFKYFKKLDEANHPSNLITLCPSCHLLAEQSQKMRSGLSGLGYIMHHLAPLYLLCDQHDLGRFTDPSLAMLGNHACIILYDQFQGGIGLCADLYRQIPKILQNAFDLIESCPCDDGCPACVGAAGEFGLTGKNDCKALIKSMLAGNYAKASS